jgi:hypothetical protein
MLNVPPGAIGGEFQVPPFAVDVCDVESLLVHVTVPPAETVTGLGLKAVVVIVDAPMTIDAATLAPEVDIVVEGVDGEDELQATEKPNRATSAIRMLIQSTLSWMPQRANLMLLQARGHVPRILYACVSQSNGGRGGKDAYESRNDFVVCKARALSVYAWRDCSQPRHRFSHRLLAATIGCFALVLEANCDLLSPAGLVRTSPSFATRFGMSGLYVQQGTRRAIEPDRFIRWCFVKARTGPHCVFETRGELAVRTVFTFTGRLARVRATGRHTAAACRLINAGHPFPDANVRIRVR